MTETGDLGSSRNNKNDEFYTQLTDIEKELRYYKEHFEGKTVLCNCDDPFESNFFKYFALNFNRLGLKKLITTSYINSPIANTELSLDEISGNKETRNKAYKAIVTKVYDTTGDGGIDMNDVAELFKTHENELVELTSNGDFRSEECVELLDEADIVVTCPPFSLFSEFFNLLIEKDKKFIILGHLQSATNKNVFPLLMSNSLFIGSGAERIVKNFYVPDDYPKASKTDKNGRKYVTFPQVVWFTNISIKNRQEEIVFYKRYDLKEYPKYDNYDAINVDRVKDIPCDYARVIGVPVNFITKYNPEQFEIVGITASHSERNTKKYPKQIQVSPNGVHSTTNVLNNRPAIKLDSPPEGTIYYEVDGEFFITTHERILVRNKKPELRYTRPEPVFSTPEEPIETLETIEEPEKPARKMQLKTFKDNVQSAHQRFRTRGEAMLSRKRQKTVEESPGEPDTKPTGTVLRRFHRKQE